MLTPGMRILPCVRPPTSAAECGPSSMRCPGPAPQRNQILWRTRPQTHPTPERVSKHVLVNAEHLEAGLSMCFRAAWHEPPFKTIHLAATTKKLSPWGIEARRSPRARCASECWLYGKSAWNMGGWGRELCRQEAHHPPATPAHCGMNGRRSNIGTLLK